MADKTIRENFFDAKAIGSLWDVAVSLKRGNPLPIDADSVFESEAKLIEYIGDKITTVAYPGQVVAVVNADSTQIFYIDQELNYHPVGAKLDADGKSIKIDDNVLKLAGFDEAADGLLAQVKVDAEGNRTLNWVSIETIAQGDGNTTYTFTGLDKESNVYFEVKASDADAATKIYIDAYNKKEIDDKFAALTDNDTTYTFADGTEGKFTVTPKDGEAIEVDTGAKDYIDGVIGDKAEGETAATGLRKEIADALAEAKKYADDNDANTIYDDTALAGRVKTLEDAGHQNAEQVSNAITTALVDYYNIDAVDDKVEALEQADADLDTAVKAAQKAAEDAQKDIDTFMGTIASDTAAIDTLNEVIALIESEDAEVSSALLAEINSLKAKFNADGKALEAVNADTLDGKDSTYFAAASDVNGLTGLHNELALDVEGIAEDVENISTVVGNADDGLVADVAQLRSDIDAIDVASDIADAMATHNSEKSHLTADDVDGQIAAKLTTADYEGKIATAKDEAIAAALIKSVDEDQFTVTDGKLTLDNIAQEKITGLAAALTTATSNAIAADVITSVNLDQHFVINDKQLGIAEGYNLLTDDDKAKLSKLTLDGEDLTISASVSAANVTGLDTWITDNRGKVAGLFSAVDADKLSNIEANAQVNKLEGVKVNGVALAITDKIVDIPAATLDKFGVVKLGSEFNTNTETGALEITEVNVNKLVQTEGDLLILDGGLASQLTV